MKTNARILEIQEHRSKDYMPLVDFESWRVAIMNHSERTSFEGMKLLERHNATDEVFVLLQGSAVLLLAGKTKTPASSIQAVRMQANKLYNVRKSVWHAILIGKDGKTLIVENRNTNDSNSELVPLTDAQRQSIRRLSKSF